MSQSFGEAKTGRCSELRVPFYAKRVEGVDGIKIKKTKHLTKKV